MNEDEDRNEALVIEAFDVLDAQRLLADKPSPRGYFDQMIDLYQDRLDVGPVWYGAVALLS